MRLENSSTISAGGSTKSGEQSGEKCLYKRFMGIMPTFRHRLSGETHLSCDEHGSLAPVHRLDSLPECWLSFNGDKTECTLGVIDRSRPFKRQFSTRTFQVFYGQDTAWN